jgi:hypothetical protein
MLEFPNADMPPTKKYLSNPLSHPFHALYSSGPGRPSNHLLIYGPSNQYPNLA